MASFQVKKATGQGFIIVPKAVYQSKGWEQGTKLSILQGIDGSLIIREIPKK
jgi:bifunctional DNA-binding transcriptional regulator/antitoxin component of YhaV-PrlF toxin-antitoxin module